MLTRIYPAKNGMVAVAVGGSTEYKKSVIISDVFFANLYHEENIMSYVIGHVIADSDNLLPLPAPVEDRAIQISCTNGVFSTIEAEDVTDLRFDFGFFSGHDFYVWDE